MKSKCCILLVLISIFTMVLPAGAFYASDGPFERLPEGWEESAQGNAGVQFQPFQDEEEGSMLLWCDTLDRMDSANTTVRTGFYQPEGNFVLRMRTAVNQSVANVNKRVRIETETGEYQELFTIVQNNLRLFGQTVEIANDTMLDLQLTINAEEGSAVLWKDGEMVYQGPAEIPAEMLSRFRLQFYHGYSNKKTRSEWYLSSVEVASAGEFQLQSQPRNEETLVDALKYETITVDFGTVITDHSLSEEQIMLTAAEGGENAQEIEYRLACQGSRVMITPIDGLKSDTIYSLLFYDLTDVFGISHGQQEIRFSTAPEDYAPPSVTISSPQTDSKFPVGYDILIDPEITEGTEAIDRVQLLINGQVEQETTDVPCQFVYTAESAGTWEVVVRVIDRMGASSDSTPVLISTFLNQAPSIQMSARDGATLTPGESVSYRAEDADGRIERVEFLINGQVMAETQEPEGSFTLPEDIAFGSVELSVAAYDEYGLRAEETAVVTVSRQEEEVVISSDFSDFEAKKTSDGLSYGSFGIVPNGAPNYAMSDVIDSEHCLVLGADAQSGVNAYLNYNVPAGRDFSQFTLRVRLFMETKQTNSNFTIRSNDVPAVFLEDVKISQGNLICADGAQQESVPVEPGWHDFVYEVDLKNGIYSFWMDGSQIADQFDFTKDISSVSALRIDMVNRESAPAKIAISYFEVRQNYTYPYFTGGEFEGGLSAKTLKLQLGTPIDSSAFQVIGGELYCEGQKQNIGTITVSDDKTAIQMELTEPVLQSCDYRAVIRYIRQEQEYTAECTVSAPFDTQLGVSSAQFLQEDGKISFSAQVVKEGEAQPVTVILAMYDQRGVMVDCVWQSGSVEAELSIVTPELEYVQGSTYRAYVRDSWPSLIPINIKVYELAAE